MFRPSLLFFSFLSALSIAALGLSAAACSSPPADDADDASAAEATGSSRAPLRVEVMLSGKAVTLLRTKRIGALRPIAPSPPDDRATLRWSFEAADGSVLASGSADDPRAMHAEFDEKGAPDRRAAKGGVGSLAVELPNVAGTLVVTTAEGKRIGSTRITPVTDEGDSEIVDLSTDVKGDAVAVVDHGDPDRHANILILPEGYQESELAQFHTDARAVADSLRAVPAYGKHWDGFNIYYQDVKSAESGITDPRGAKKTTAFDVAFGDDSASPRRCIMIAESVKAQNYRSMRALADEVKADVVVLLANTTEYAGCANNEGRFITVSRDPRASRVLAHELGHALFRLADEYSGGGVACEPSRWRRDSTNVSSDLSALPWSDMLTTRTLPTPLGSGGGVTGAFEGGGYCDTGVYRPHESCMMRDLEADLCPVCLRAIDRFFDAMSSGGDPAGRSKTPGTKVTITNATGGPVFVACTGIEGPGCSGWVYLNTDQTQTIETIGGELYLDTSTVTGAPIRWRTLRLTAASSSVTLVANADNPLGAPAGSGPTWACEKSSYRGTQLWTCSGTSLFRCENGAPVEHACPNGCRSNPVGTDDACE